MYISLPFNNIDVVIA